MHASPHVDLFIGVGDLAWVVMLVQQALYELSPGPGDNTKTLYRQD